MGIGEIFALYLVTLVYLYLVVGIVHIALRFERLPEHASATLGSWFLTWLRWPAL